MLDSACGIGLDEAGVEARVVRSGWRFPNGSDGPHVLSIDLELTGPNGVEQRSHTVEMYPFSVQDLRDRLREVGFAVVTLDAHLDEDRYTVVARRR